MENIRKQITELVKRSRSILVMPSAPPDGDSLGSSLALYLAFKKMGKEVTVCMAEPVPDAFQFLPTTNVISNEFTATQDFIVTLDCEKAKLKTIHTKLEHNKVNVIITAKSGQFSAQDVSFHHGPSKYDLIITVDTGDLSQLGRFYEDNTQLFTQIPLINIDHHASNDHFGKVNYVDVMSSSTTELLIPLMQDFERETGLKLLDEDIATLLLAGIITDTGSFQNANTTPKSFASSALLIKHGARQQEIIQHVFKTKHLSTLRLWGRILSNIKIDKKHHIVWSTISKKDFKDTGSRADETGGIIDELMTNAPGTEIVLLLKERDDGLISGSLRSTNDSVDASIIASLFGGGGHVRAAGFKIKSDDIFATEKMVVEKIREYQKKRLNLDYGEETTPPEKTNQDQEKTLPTSTNIHKIETKREITEEIVMEKPKDEVLKQTTADSDESEQKAENFTDIIVKKAARENGETFELHPGLTYKFED